MEHKKHLDAKVSHHYRLKAHMLRSDEQTVITVQRNGLEPKIKVPTIKATAKAKVQPELC